MAKKTAKKSNKGGQWKGYRNTAENKARRARRVSKRLETAARKRVARTNHTSSVQPSVEILEPTSLSTKESD